MRQEPRRNWNLFPKSWGLSFRGGSRGGNLKVHAIEPPHRPPATLIEQRLATVLKEAGTISAADLVKRTAADLYEAELRSGAAAVDIGLLGERLFDRDIVRELYAGDGMLWDIARKIDNS